MTNVKNKPSVKKYQKYRNNPKYLKRQSFANSVDPDQTPLNAASDRVYTVCHSSSTTLDTSKRSKMDYFKF